MLIKVMLMHIKCNDRRQQTLTRSQNLVQGELVNGSVGQVIGFSTSQEAQTNLTDIAEVDESKTIVHGSPTAQNPVIKNDRVWPVVRFTNGKTVLIVPAKFTVNNADGHLEASREQVSHPLSPLLGIINNTNSLPS